MCGSFCTRENTKFHTTLTRYTGKKDYKCSAVLTMCTVYNITLNGHFKMAIKKYCINTNL